jgi:hypothetical protein
VRTPATSASTARAHRLGERAPDLGQILAQTLDRGLGAAWIGA